MKPVDFRAQNLPMAGTVFRGNRRKYSNEEAELTAGASESSASTRARLPQKEMLNKIIKENHPKMEAMLMSTVSLI